MTGAGLQTNTDAERVSDIVAELRELAAEYDMLATGYDAHGNREDADVEYVKVDFLRAAADIIEAQSKALAEAREYAARLLVSFVTEHCNPVPEWAPLPDLMGVLTQLDNATTVTRDMKAALAEATALDAALTSCAAMLAFLRQREGECLGDHPD